VNKKGSPRRGKNVRRPLILRVGWGGKKGNGHKEKPRGFRRSFYWKCSEQKGETIIKEKDGGNLCRKNLRKGGKIINGS